MPDMTLSITLQTCVAEWDQKPALGIALKSAVYTAEPEATPEPVAAA